MQGLNRKVIVFKYKKKKNYRRNIGHRQVISDDLLWTRTYMFYIDITLVGKEDWIFFFFFF